MTSQGSQSESRSETSQSNGRKAPLTLNAALRRLGYDKTEITVHGLRSTASSLLNESGKWSADAIERQLAHQDQDEVRAAYVHAAEFWPERVRMMKWWANYLDELRERGRVVAIKAAS
ncbi:tyrosine-type recombinase/integrase [Bradyrhizobium diazoefficiens]